jgi:hypothetical protein
MRTASSRRPPGHTHALFVWGKGSNSTLNALSARERFKPGHVRHVIEVYWHQWIRSVLKLSTQMTCHSDLEEGSASSLKVSLRFGFSHNTCINSYSAEVSRFCRASATELQASGRQGFSEPKNIPPLT